jgi:hypothetical protein
MSYKTYTVLSLVIVSGAALSQEKPEDSCGKIMEYYKAGDLEGATEEAQWCLEALQAVKQGRAGEFFKADVAGWKRGELQQNNALGFAMTEAPYSKGDKSLTVSLMGSAGGANSLGGFLGGLAQAGIGAAGQRSRIQGHTAVAMSESGSNQLMITLESGGSLNIASSDASMDEVKAFAEAFPITELDESRR